MRNNDLVAGLCVAGLMLPEAVANAGIAGLAPQHAIFAGIAGCLAYAVAGRSRFAVVSATSSSAAILAATLAVMPVPAADRAALAAIIVLGCPLSGGPLSMMEITRKGTLHAVEEAQARGDYREAA